MKLTGEDRKYILGQHLRNIAHISDKKYQERVWIRGEGPEVNDFDETVNHFFDNGDPILKNFKDYGVTETQYKILKDFRDKFEIFSDKNSWPPEFIDTPEWDHIMKMAKEVLKAFNYTRA